MYRSNLTPESSIHMSIVRFRFIPGHSRPVHGVEGRNTDVLGKTVRKRAHTRTPEICLVLGCEPRVTNGATFGKWITLEARADCLFLSYTHLETVSIVE